MWVRYENENQHENQNQNQMKWNEMKWNEMKGENENSRTGCAYASLK